MITDAMATARNELMERIDASPGITGEKERSMVAVAPEMPVIKKMITIATTGTTYVKMMEVIKTNA
jgi:hypothetical protein